MTARAGREKRYWLMKCEPSAYTIAALQEDQTTSWEGVRNFQARNFLRDEMRKGDPVIFYASNAAPSGVTGLAEVSRGGYPDPTAFDPEQDYFDEKSNPENPTWYVVDLQFVEQFPRVVSLEELKSTKGLEKMMVTQKGSRLSVQTVTKKEYEIVVKLGRKKKP